MADYTIIFDGGSRGNHRSGAREGYGSYAVIARDGRSRITRLEFGDCTNNEAEYLALCEAVEDIVRVILAAGRRPCEFTIEIRGDSQLVLNQVSGEWKVKNPRMRDLCSRAQAVLDLFGEWDAIWHPREESVRVLGH